ncbi:hypothetical protein GNY06_02965 [Elizabethkingia argentiflava]|uniref:Uncharacterized protein n=1 Tax=Elizabethkingia argenteiflava TaxID=2681556 RepID=A0A845PRC0_9FLAO|nr:hypothetical protein [Elizabethkingia argenteiflava]NAW50394.1 hypothetical protein [Elizabethkingia argenteiflava]
MKTKNLLKRFSALEQRIRRNEKSLEEAKIEANTLKKIIDNSQSIKKQELSVLASSAVSKRNARLGIKIIDGKPVKI